MGERRRPRVYRPVQGGWMLADAEHGERFAVRFASDEPAGGRPTRSDGRRTHRRWGRGIGTPSRSSASGSRSRPGRRVTASTGRSLASTARWRPGTVRRWNWPPPTRASDDGAPLGLGKRGAAGSYHPGRRGGEGEPVRKAGPGWPGDLPGPVARPERPGTQAQLPLYALRRWAGRCASGSSCMASSSRPPGGRACLGRSAPTMFGTRP
jgi:hypothetical protein